MFCVCRSRSKRRCSGVGSPLLRVSSAHARIAHRAWARRPAARTMASHALQTRVDGVIPGRDYTPVPHTPMIRRDV